MCRRPNVKSSRKTPDWYIFKRGDSSHRQACGYPRQYSYDERGICVADTKLVEEYIQNKAKGDIILPGVIHSRTGFSAKEIHSILEQLVDRGILTRKIRMTCPKCKKDFESETGSCPYCGHPASGQLHVYEKK